MKRNQLKLNAQGIETILSVGREHGIPGYQNIADAAKVNIASIRSNFSENRSINPNTAEKIYQALNQDSRIEFLHDYAKSRQIEEKYLQYFKLRDVEQLSEIVAELEKRVYELERGKNEQ